MNDKIFVTSMANSIVGFSIPERHFTRTWPRKGTRLPIEKELLLEAIYQPGVEYLFRKGILYIDDMDFKIELGLEQPETTTENATILALDDKLAMRIIKFMPVSEARVTIEKLSDVQKQELVDFAAKHSDELDMSHIDIINKLCKTDLLKIISLRKTTEE